jgi:hypothetical protein
MPYENAIQTPFETQPNTPPPSDRGCHLLLNKRAENQTLNHKLRTRNLYSFPTHIAPRNKFFPVLSVVSLALLATFFLQALGASTRAEKLSDSVSNTLLAVVDVDPIPLFVLQQLGSGVRV